MMKLARKLSVLFVVFVMVLSTFSFSSVLADNETNVLTAESGTYTADKTKPYDGNWNIVRWLTDRPDTYLDSATGKYVMQPKFQQEFAFIVGGIAEGSSITNFKLDISKWIDENKNTLQIYATDYIDSLKSEWTKLTWTKSSESGADDTNNNISIASCDNIPKARGYRYIKIVVSSSRSKDYTWQDCISGFSFSWVKNDVGGESGTYKTNITEPFDGNWHIISWETVKPDDVTWSYGGNHAMQSDNEFIYVTGGVPEGSAITNFSIDVTTSIGVKKIVDIYASDSLNGTWTTLSYTDSDISDNEVGNPDGNKVAKKIDLSFDKSLGYRYIKIKKNANTSGGSWQWMLGGFSFVWEGIPTVTVDYAKEDSTLKATVKLINQTDFSPFVAFAGYDSENNLIDVSYHQEGVLTGSRKIEYEIPAVGVAKARVYVWNYSDLSPLAVLDDFITASAAE